MKNSLADLNNHLFEALERLNDAEDPEEIDREIERSRAVSEVGTAIIRNAQTALKAIELYGNDPNLPEQLRLET